MLSVVVVHNGFAMWISNILSAFKVIILAFIVVTGWVVLGGGTRVQDPHSHFKDGFAGTNNNGNALAGAIINVIFAYTGWYVVHLLDALDSSFLMHLEIGIT